MTEDVLSAINSNFKVSEVEPIADDASTVFSINTAWLNLRGAKAIYHPIELFLMRKAVDHLLGNGCNVVLLDIFRRGDDGAIEKIRGKSDLEVHTVLLYKNPQVHDNKVELIVIDPSNSKFSYHLSQWGKLLQYDNIAVEIETLLEGKNGLKIYKPFKKPTGPDYEQYRDCIDIAVKLGFALSSYDGRIDVTEISGLPAVKAISNIPAIDDTVFYSGKKDKDITVRIQQSSDMDVVEEFSRIMRLTKEVISAADRFDIEEVSNKKVIPCFKKILQAVGHQQEYSFDELMEYNHQCIGTIEEASTKLVGNLKNMEEELNGEQKED